MSSGVVPLERRDELPRSAARHPARYLLHPLRPIARWLLSRWLTVRVTGAEHFPATGPAIVACNHVGIADGPLLAIFGPRPVHALTKREMFKGLLGPFLLRAGQIPLDRFNSDPLAIKRCLRVLRSGGAIGIFPEGARGAGEFERFHRGVAYLAMVTGAPIVPVVQFGTREPGAGHNSLPARGVVVDMVFGELITVPAQPWPRRKHDVTAVSLKLRERMIGHLDHAKAVTGRSLPGPLPARDTDPDPATGVTDQEAM